MIIKPVAAPLPDVVFFQEGPGLRTHQWASEGMKVINVTNILADGTVDVSNTDKFISQTEFETRYPHFAVEENDIVVASSGNTYGKVGRIRAAHLPLMMNTSVIRFHSADRSRLLDDFLYLFLRAPAFKEQVAAFVTGGAQPNFGPSHLRRMRIPLPSLESQKASAEAVSAYDDLIENNRRRIQLLEQSARLLYKEWFVHFRFPGHEHVKTTDGVPEGWMKVPLGSIAPLNYGKALKAEARVPGAIPVYGSSGIVGSHDKPLAPGPAIVVGRKGNVGSVFWSPVDFYAIDTVYFIEASKSSAFLFHSLQSMTFISTDVAVPGLNRDFAHSRLVLIPPTPLLESFEEAVQPIMKQITTLESYSAKLARARDLLLPRLMSGELAV